MQEKGSSTSSCILLIPGLPVSVPHINKYALTFRYQSHQLSVYQTIRKIKTATDLSPTDRWPCSIQAGFERKEASNGCDCKEYLPIECCSDAVFYTHSTPETASPKKQSAYKQCVYYMGFVKTNNCRISVDSIGAVVLSPTLIAFILQNKYSISNEP